MEEIQILAPEVANMIAAGEVVERPASVVKELMENAVDAGATEIVVELSSDKLVVRDNGRGIPPSQLEKAFLRHATSKLKSAEHLAQIATLGFRGEALAAIASVSKVMAISATVEGEFAHYVLLEGGEVKEKGEKERGVGTTMEVSDIFFNTPARKKFMKSQRSEASAILALVQEMALSHPEISIKYYREGKEELYTTGDGKISSGIFHVLGKNIAAGLREISLSDLESKVEGFVSLPSCCRASRSYQHFFVNGRYIKSPLLAAAVENGYENQKMVGRFPALVLYIQLPFEDLDVNVHPAKTTVKFAREKEVFQLVYQAVKSGLKQHKDIQKVELTSKNTNSIPSSLLEKEVPPYPSHTAILQSPLAEESQTSFSVPNPRKENTTSNIPKIDYNFNGFSSLEEEELEEEETLPRRKSSIDTAENNQFFLPLKEKEEEVRKEKPEETTLVRNPEKSLRHLEEDYVEETIEPMEPSWRVVGEFFKTYIVIEVEDEIYFVDKHAAHERMNFERIKSQEYTPMAQVLLKPQVLQLAPEEKAILLENIPLLKEFSFDVEEFSQDAVIIREAPYDIPLEKISETLVELVQKLKNGDTPDPTSARDSLLHSIACQSAIKAGYDTHESEQNLLAKIIMEDKVRHCPHGRPIVASLTKKDLEKKFKRTL